MKKSKTLTWVCFISTCCVIAAAVVFTFFARDALEWYVNATGRPEEIIEKVLRTYYSCCPAAFLALFLLLRLLFNVARERVFIKESVHILRAISLCILFDGILCAVVGWRYLPFLLLTLIAVFAALLLWVLSQVFKTAVEIKAENELTI